MTRLRLTALPLALLLASCAQAGGSPRAASEPAPLACTSPGARLAPRSGTLLGVDLDWSRDDPSRFVQRSGTSPAVYSVFAPYAMERKDRALVDRAATAVAKVRGALVLTLEPTRGLDKVTPAQSRRIADQLRGYGGRGIPVYVRFAEEMNGSWFPWGQQPQAFVRAFQDVASAVHTRAPLAAMVWAPNYAVGYPFRDARQQFDKSDPATSQLDTNGDGRLTRADDPYAPYWPGDAAVDWVGMSLFHWGDSYPWDTQTLPEKGKFLAQLTGTYGGAAGATSAVPDFVQLYSVAKHKPFAVTETAARYSPGQPGPAEAAMKKAWLAQVTSPAVAAAVPTLRMVTWLEWDRTEPETRNRVDWRMTADPALAADWKAAIPTTWRTSGDLGLCRT